MGMKEGMTRFEEALVKWRGASLEGNYVKLKGSRVLSFIAFSIESEVVPA